ncbi:signal peptidase [Paraburkholderia lacunae]|uniref:Signal peptidase n=1 Tax=Paraburkholderia lacunae TaxID=2211104 RepID=A0A370NFP1_9BURK|nr:signal peptidase [Paraburkholderia lacunae]RDK04375.1 signal peptidase [Paraburkholderia lacunae]
MKKSFVLVALAAVVLTQAGCSTDVKSLPLDAARAQQTGGVRVYFGSQAHPAVRSQLGDVSYSVRIARKVAGADEACREALAEAVQKLRKAAQDRNANAVIDVSTRFHSVETASPTDFTCGVSGSAAAIAVKGQLVVLENN